MKWLCALALAAAVAGCATSPQLPAASGETLDPIAFFDGRSHGEGKLDKLIGETVAVSVDSVGRRSGDTLVLDQSIREGDKEPRTRRWIIRRIAPALYSGSLSEAEGPVSMTIEGPRALIRYRMRDGGLQVEQQLALQPDGRTLLNRLAVHKFGVRVATLRETIRKSD